MQVEIRLQARPYQKEVIDYFRSGGKRAICIWHRKAGKDRVATFIESELAMKRPGLYWHALPKYEEARKVIWDAITPEGKRLIDVSFPDAICKSKNAHEMKITLLNGSIWQPIGADNFDSLVGASPVHVTLSEYAIMHPHAWQFIRPALAQNNGSALFITTPRGYNHAHETYQYGKTAKGWFASLRRAEDTGVLSEEILAEERATMPDELYRQEYECNFSASNVGAILGRWIENAEREGRIGELEPDFNGSEIEVSADLGFHDTASWWFWQPKSDGFALLDYMGDSGMDAGEWIERIKTSGYKIGRIWLPHDARAKTFATQHSPMEQFLKAFGDKIVQVVPMTKKLDRINAARYVLPKCHFDSDRCKDGLMGLRSWQFEYNEQTKAFSKEPQHDWASHPGDAFSYGALVMQERITKQPEVKPIRGYAVGNQFGITFDEMWKDHEKSLSRRQRI